MRILITGGGGLVGRAVIDRLTALGHQTIRLLRPASEVAPGRQPAGGAADSQGTAAGDDSQASGAPAGRQGGEQAGHPAGPWWDIPAGRIDLSQAGAIDAVIHLAGENIMGLWTAGKRERILTSRRDGTALLAGALARIEPRPRVLLCASAVGYYGCGIDQPLDESAPSGSTFLSEVCRQWEAAADPARDAGIRTCHLRMGMVLSAGGGAMAAMIKPFRLHLGSVVGGNQWWSWIHLADVVGAIELLLAREDLAGPVNLASPQPVRGIDFARALGRAMGRRVWLRMPACIARVLLGRMGREVLLCSLQARPGVLERAGFEFRYAELEKALAAEADKREY